MLVFKSNAEVGSSKIKTLGFFRTARNIFKRGFVAQTYL
ncbi:hypothetical protein L313_3011 [Acinetobacter haemolyticus CIP 64.3 = MTCC 9819]|nr:hypothetical protein L313_3011 [Acinetobacter haemolyticus CIP 64.3 = MTCC 9819]